MTQADAGFDIGSLDSVVETTFNVPVILDADGNPKSGFVISGKDSDGYRDAAHKIRVESLQRASKRKALIDTSTIEGAETMAKTIEANDLMLACSVVVGWFGFANGGAVAEFDAAVAKKMLVKFPTWRNRVLEALENDANFTKG